MRSRLGILFLLLTLPTAVFAQDDWRDKRPDDDEDEDRDRRGRYSRRDNSVELTPFVGYTFGGTIFADETQLFRTDVNVASNPNLGVIFGIPLSDSGLKLELMANRQASELEREGGLFNPNAGLADVDVTYYHAGLQFPVGDSNRVRPFFVASAGLANIAPDLLGVSAENRFSASAGFGVKVPLSRGFALRAEGRGYFTALEEDSDCSFCDAVYDQNFYQGQVNVGLVFSF